MPKDIIETISEINNEILIVTSSNDANNSRTIIASDTYPSFLSMDILNDDFFTPYPKKKQYEEVIKLSIKL